jgi:lactoylglutathione lyase
VTEFREAMPILGVDDVERAARFYEEALGFERAYRWPLEGELEFVFLRLPPLGIGITRADGDSLSVYTDDIERATERLRDAGARLVAEPAEQPWGERMATFETPDGRALHVFQTLDREH